MLGAGAKEIAQQQKPKAKTEKDFQKSLKIGTRERFRLDRITAGKIPPQTEYEKAWKELREAEKAIVKDAKDHNTLWKAGQPIPTELRYADIHPLHIDIMQGPMREIEENLRREQFYGRSIEPVLEEARNFVESNGLSPKYGKAWINLLRASRT